MSTEGVAVVVKNVLLLLQLDVLQCTSCIHGRNLYYVSCQ